MSDPSSNEPPVPPPADGVPQSAASPGPTESAASDPGRAAEASPPLQQDPPAEGVPADGTSVTLAAPEKDPARSKDKVTGTVIVVAGFVLSLGISLWAKHASRPEVSDPPGPPTTEGVEGFPDRVDPIATLPAARTLTRRPMLRGITADAVKSDGTVDLSEGPGRVRYTFQSPAGHGPQPPREPGTLPRLHYCGKQSVALRKEGLVAERDRPETVCPGKHADPLPDPQCSFQRVWQQALKEGAPADRFARIEYYRSRSGPVYRFEIAGTKHRFTLHGDCERRVTGADATNISP